MKNILLLFITFLSLSSIAQDETVDQDQIKKLVKEIENNASLIQTEYDWCALTGIALDGGGILKIWKDEQNEVHKIYKELGFSYGRVKTTFYLIENVPIQIIEVEDNFGHKNQEINYQELNEVFRVSIYVTDWEMGESIIERTGKRVMSETPCSIFDYEPVIRRVIKLMQ